MKKEKKNDFGGVHGFKNGAPAHASNNWQGVDLFLHTWGFLPNDDSVLEKLTKEQLINLCHFAMESACRIDLMGEGIKATQKVMHEYGISPEAISNLSADYREF